MKLFNFIDQFSILVRIKETYKVNSSYVRDIIQPSPSSRSDSKRSGVCWPYADPIPLEVSLRLKLFPLYEIVLVELGFRALNVRFIEPRISFLKLNRVFVNKMKQSFIKIV